MNNQSQNNKRIAKNTIINYISMFASMLIGLFSSRFVLQALGASDYGLYNVVGGIIAMFSFISTAMSNTTVRFINFELGKDNGNPNKVFNICNVVHIAIALLIFVLLETIGVWYILNYLKVSPGKESDAMIVFQISLLTCCLNITNTPYSSLFNAFEKFAFTAAVNIGLKLVQLFGIVLLLFYKGDALLLYAIIMSATSIISFCIFRFSSCYYWPNITHWNLQRNKNDYKQVLAFNNYTLLGSFSMMLRGQGSNLLINYFFGTVVNAAYAIAMVIQGYVQLFLGNFDGAVAPQLTKSVSSSNTDRRDTLVFLSCKTCILLAEIMVIPLFYEMDFVLHLWLGNVPNGTTEFSNIILLLVLVGSTSGGHAQFVNSSGKIKWFKISLSVLYISCIPIGFVLFKLGYPPYTILFLFIIADVIYRIIEMTLSYKILHFNTPALIKFAYIRPLVILFLMTVFYFLYRMLPFKTSIMHFAGLLLTLIVTMILVWLIGFTGDERRKIIGTFLKK